MNKSWQVLLWPIGVLVTVLLFIFVLQAGFEFLREYRNDRPENTISVSAQGKVKAVPDTAVVTLGVLAQGADSKKVQSDAVAKINQITEFVKSLGVKKEDITTSQSSINPRYDWQSGQNKIVGYESRQTVTVKVRGVNESSDIVGKILAGAVENGANEVYGSNFTIDDPDDLKQEARKLAIAEAKVKAEELAREAGIRLGKVLSISEAGDGYYPPIIYSKEAGIGRGGVAMDQALPAPSIEVGSQEIVQNITLIFEIK